MRMSDIYFISIHLSLSEKYSVILVLYMCFFKIGLEIFLHFVHNRIFKIFRYFLKKKIVKYIFNDTNTHDIIHI